MGLAWFGKKKESLLAEDILVADRIDPADLKILEEGLAQNARAHGAPPYQENPLFLLLRDGAGRLVAGATGETFWNWLYIDTLWVREDCRHKGYARALVARAEDEARARGCLGAYLWTESFEGPELYSRLGYKRFVEKRNFPVGFSRIGFMRVFA